jgi:hypothetical protein
MYSEMNVISFQALLKQQQLFLTNESILMMFVSLFLLEVVHGFIYRLPLTIKALIVKNIELTNNWILMVL